MQAKNEAKWEAIDLSLSLCKEPVKKGAPRRLTMQLEGIVFIWEWRCMSSWANILLFFFLSEASTEAEAKVHPIQLI